MLVLEYIATDLLKSGGKQVVIQAILCHSLKYIHPCMFLLFIYLHLSCMFRRVDHDSTKPEFCSCNKKLSQGLRDISINKVGLFSFTEKRRKTSVYFSFFSCSFHCTSSSFFSRFPWPSPYMEDRNDYYKLYISLCCPGFID